jgi:maltose/moltooligosaccharide transporter
MDKPRLSFWQIWNMSFGFFGIQFGWGLQLGNMSAIYETLHAKPDEIAFLWLAAPMTGLLVQPIIGSMSDRTWNRLGRRRPYFLCGAILSSLALFLMPTSSSLWMAAGLLWVLDASINISMEPFRAFVADKLNDEQRTIGFVAQSFFIGAGATLAAMPFILRKLGVTGATDSGISLTIKYSFWAGAVVFLGAVLWTVVSSKEYPPEDLKKFREGRLNNKGLTVFAEIFSALREMPQTMKQLAAVQFFTWLGLFCMWIFFGPMTARHVFGVIDPVSQKEIYDRGTEWGTVCFAVYSVVCLIVAFALPTIAAATSRKSVHAFALVCGGVGLLSVYFIRDPYLLLLPMVGVGIAWASILSMPYAILAGVLPPSRMGVYMGIFNFFIVLPEITASLTFQPLVKNVFNNNPLYVVMLGGGSMLTAALLLVRVRDTIHKPADLAAILEGDRREPILVQESAQPVPSTGLIDQD